MDFTHGSTLVLLVHIVPDFPIITTVMQTSWRVPLILFKSLQTSLIIVNNYCNIFVSQASFNLFSGFVPYSILISNTIPFLGAKVQIHLNYFQSRLLVPAFG